MPQINLASGRNSTVTMNAGAADEMRWWPYSPGDSLNLLRRAITAIEHNIFKKNNACNNYFKRLAPASPHSFDDIWSDASIWISYEPRVGLDWDGVTNSVGGKEISIGEDAFKKSNFWYVAGVLVHELAHCAGAGGAPSIAASTALRFCGLASLYDGAVGTRLRVADAGERVV